MTSAKDEWTVRATLVDHSKHQADCIDYASYRAYVNDMVASYPSIAAISKGIELIDAGIVDCQCMTQE